MGYEVVRKSEKFNLDTLKEQENERIQEAVIIERDWWAPYAITDEREAIASGRLIELRDEGPNFRLIGPIRRGEEPRSLNLRAFNLFFEIQDRWRETFAAKSRSSANIRLSVASLYRNGKFQERLHKTTHLASQGFSAHTAGAAIDFDPNGYFLGTDRLPVATKSRRYSAVYTLTLRSVLERLVEESRCHVVWEYGFEKKSGNIIKYVACVHVCATPGNAY